MPLVTWSRHLCQIEVFTDATAFFRCTLCGPLAEQAKIADDEMEHQLLRHVTLQNVSGRAIDVSAPAEGLCIALCVGSSSVHDRFGHAGVRLPPGRTGEGRSWSLAAPGRWDEARAFERGHEYAVAGERACRDPCKSIVDPRRELIPPWRAPGRPGVRWRHDEA